MFFSFRFVQFSSCYCRELVSYFVNFFVLLIMLWLNLADSLDFGGLQRIVDQKKIILHLN